MTRLVEIRRVSTEEQAKDDRAGLKRQAHNNRETAKRLGATVLQPAFELTDVCRENFIATPEWRGICKLIEPRDVHIVVDDPDRFIADFGGIEILAECQRTGTLIYHPGGVLDPSTLDGQLVGVIRAVLAGNELKSIKRRVQGAKEAKRREGIFPSASISLPTGIAYVRTKGKPGRWTYNDEIVRVREVWRLVADEGIHTWTEVGRRTGFSGQTVRNILSNAIYKGWWVIDERREQGPTPIKADGRRKDRRKVPRAPAEVIRHEVFRPKGSRSDKTGREEAIVDESTWDDVQTLIAEKRDGYHRLRDANSGARFPYTGRLWCHECGLPIWSRTKPKHGRSKTRRDWYACKSTQTAGNKCGTKYLPRDVVNVGLDRFFTQVLTDQRFAVGLVKGGLAAERADYSDRIDSLKGLLKNLASRRQKLLDLYLTGGWSQAELDARRTRLDVERERQERDLRRLEQQQKSADKAKVLEAFREVLQTLHEYEFWSTSQKREFLAKFFPRIEVSKRGVERVHVQLPASLVGGVEETDGSLVLKVGLAWDKLQPPVEMTEFGLPKKPFYSSSELGKVLGLSSWSISNRIAKGLIPHGTQRHRGNHAWSLAEVCEIARNVPAVDQPHRWGLPKKDFYTSGDVAEIVGVTWEQLRYAIKLGRVAECHTRDDQGHRMWTEVEVERAAAAFGAKARGRRPRSGSKSDLQGINQGKRD